MEKEVWIEERALDQSAQKLNAAVSREVPAFSLARFVTATVAGTEKQPKTKVSFFFLSAVVLAS